MMLKWNNDWFFDVYWHNTTRLDIESQMIISQAQCTIIIDDNHTLLFNAIIHKNDNHIPFLWSYRLYNQDIPFYYFNSRPIMRQVIAVPVYYFHHHGFGICLIPIDIYYRRQIYRSPPFITSKNLINSISSLLRLIIILIKYSASFHSNIISVISVIKYD